jgi:predicted permease
MPLFRKLLRTIDPRPLDCALDDELRFHLEQRTDEFIAQGMSPAEARRQAQLLFGNPTALRESTRDRDVLVWLETTLQDLRYALRGMRQRPGFTIAAVLSLALGIGANTAIFTLLDQVLLRNLPVRNPQQLVQLKQIGLVYGSTMGDDAFSYPLYKDLRDRNQAFSGVLGQFPVTLSVAFGSHTERVPGELVSGNYFEVLGVAAALGRTIAPQDDVQPGGHPLAVLAYDYWQSQFSGDPAVLGRTITVDGLPLTIVGVSQKGFDGLTLGRPARIRIPLAMKSQMTQGVFAEDFNLSNRRAYWVEVFARLKPGIIRQQAQASLHPLMRSLFETEVREKGFENAPSEAKSAFLKSSVELLPAERGKSGMRSYEAPLLILMAIVAVVLLIACANVANLLLARSAARQREMALRLAIGASVGRIVRQLLVECLLLSITGGAAGLLLAVWMDRLLLRFLTASNLVATPDLKILGFTLAVCVLTGMLFGLAPAWAARGVDVAPTLKVDGRMVGSSAVKFRGALVIAQVSLCVLLLVVAGQFVRSLIALRSVNMGLRTDHILEFSVNPSMNGYTKEQSGRFYRALMEKVRHVPQIESAGASALAVLGQEGWSPGITVDSSGPQPGTDNPNATLVSPGYLSTLGIPLVLGRDFSSADENAPHGVVIVNQAFARQYYGDRNPVGHRLGLGNEPGTPTNLEIIGVVRDSKFFDVRETIGPLIYFDNDQNPDVQQINVYLRSATDSSRVFTAIRQAVTSLDPAIPPFAMRTLDEQAELTLVRDRMVTTLASIFGAVAALLAAIGIYGLMSFNVARRTREIAVRMALGANSGTVTWMVLREVLALAGAGIAVALPAAWALMGLVQSQLFGVKPHDPVSLWMAAGILALVALFAGYLPVRRAAAIEPMAALRAE